MNCKKKKRVVIVEALSTGFNFIQDCLDRNLEPVILEVVYAEKKAYDVILEEREEKYRKIKTPVKILQEKSTYEETFSMIKDLEPDLVIPGSEDGVILATRLSDDLGLKGNPYALIDKMTNKYHMHNALKEAGIRHIRGKVCSTIDDALNFYDELNCKRVVVKPPHGAGSMGVSFCDNRENFIKTFNDQMNEVGCLGDVTQEQLIQECIEGNEYTVNTITIDGNTYVASIWKYEKITTESGAHIYVGNISVDEITPEIFVLVEYAFSVIKALGIKNGPVHGEYMMDEKGPVLIEVNCRCMGGSFPAAYGDEIFGHHETDIALESYIDPETAVKRLSKPYGVKKHAIVKFMIAPENINIQNSPILSIIPYLKSFYSCSLKSFITDNKISETVDLETSAGTINLFHEDISVLKQEYELLKLLEAKYFGLLHQEFYSEEKISLPVVKEKADSLKLVEIKQKELGQYPLEDVYFFLRKNIETVKKGGSIIIDKEVYDGFTYGLSGMIMVLKIFGLNIQPPFFNDKKLVAIKI